LDTPLLVELTNRKFQSLADVLQTEGWKWVEIQPELNYQFLGRFRRLISEPTPLTEKEAAKIDRLTARRKALESKLTDDDEEANEKFYERIQAKVFLHSHCHHLPGRMTMSTKFGLFGGFGGLGC
jgi:ParB family transcriptional regulator, chromosome partitioning protein